MPTPLEIKNMARKVSDLKDDLSNESSRCHGQVDNSNTWWLGEAGKDFRNRYKELRTDIKSLISKLNTLYSNMNKLADKVQQAEDDKKARDAAAARAALAAEKQRLVNAK